MNLMHQFAVTSTLILAISQAALAVQVSNQITPSPASVSSSGIVERGGTIDTVDLANKILVVDKVKYALPAIPVKVHALAGKIEERNGQLKAGMQIRFNTSKANYSAQEQVQEIWISRLNDKANKK